MTGSESSKADILARLQGPAGKRQGHSARRGYPAISPEARHPRVPGRIVAVASADSPGEGRRDLATRRSRSSPRTERVAHPGQQAGAGRPDAAPAWRAVADGKVQFVSGISDAELAELVASAEIAVVPSLYEGFSLPAVEHMASGTPLVASRTGALPEVTGDAAVLVTPGDAEELCAALRMLHDSPAERDRLSQAALARVAERFAWQAVARATVAEYRRPSRRAGRQGTLDGGGRGGRAMLTVDFHRLPIQPGTRLLDLGCGAGRHAFRGSAPRGRGCCARHRSRRTAASVGHRSCNGRGGRDPGPG